MAQDLDLVAGFAAARPRPVSDPGAGDARKIIHPAVAGIDAHNKQVTVTVLTPAATPEGYTATVKVFHTFWKPCSTPSGSRCSS